jgi:hypothetical protein
MKFPPHRETWTCLPSSKLFWASPVASNIPTASEISNYEHMNFCWKIHTSERSMIANKHASSTSAILKFVMSNTMRVVSSLHAGGVLHTFTHSNQQEGWKVKNIERSQVMQYWKVLSFPVSSGGWARFLFCVPFIRNGSSLIFAFMSVQYYGGYRSTSRHSTFWKAEMWSHVGHGAALHANQQSLSNSDMNHRLPFGARSVGWAQLPFSKYPWFHATRWGGPGIAFYIRA